MSCRSWWRNCALEADAEILKIDGMEDEIAPLGPSVPRIRELISTLELCHHKAERWVLNIIEAIGRGETNKGLGTRSSGRHHAVERVWQDAYAALSAWCAGRPSGGLDFSVGPVAASGMLAGLGERSPLKEWQVLALLGEPTEVSRWLAASLDKTIRLQLNPTAELRALSALAGPAWIRQ